MPCDFDKLVEIRNTHSLKWDVKENEQPMWVADMDFQTAPEILTAICADNGGIRDKNLKKGIVGD